MCKDCQIRFEGIEITGPVDTFELEGNKEWINSRSIERLREYIKERQDKYFSDKRESKRLDRYLYFDGIDHNNIYPSSDLYQRAIKRYQEHERILRKDLERQVHYVNYCIQVLHQKIQAQVNN